MMTQNKRLKPGDVLEFRVADQLAYLHYVGKHPEYGDAVVVHPKMHRHRTSVTEALSGGYVTFYPATAALAQGLVEKVGNAHSPGLPRRFRRPGAIVGSRVKTWIIEGGWREVVKEKLSEEELKLPIASIWNHEFLVTRVTQDWRPECEGTEDQSANQR